MTVRGFHHTSFTVSDLCAAEAFFVDLFGMTRLGGGTYDFEYIRRTVAIPNAVLEIAVLGFSDRGTTELLELIEYRCPKGEPVDTATNRPGNAHLCLLVDDIHSEYDRLRQRGVVFKSPPNRVTTGVNEGAWSVYFNGPDRIALELLQPKAMDAEEII